MHGRQEPILKTAGAQVHGFNPELRCFFPINSPPAGTLSGLLRKQYENLFFQFNPPKGFIGLIGVGANYFRSEGETGSQRPHIWQ